MVVKSEDVEHEIKLISRKKNKPYPFNKAEISRCPSCNEDGAKAIGVENGKVYLQCEVCYEIFKKVV